VQAGSINILGKVLEKKWRLPEKICRQGADAFIYIAEVSVCIGLYLEIFLFLHHFAAHVVDKKRKMV
jgi:hypothetical protein